MMAPLPNPTPPPDRPDLPRVRLEVRAAGGRAVAYEVGGDEFLIGGAAGCDLRLPLAATAPVVCQITRKVDGVLVRRLAPNVAVLLNGAPLPAHAPAPVADRDRLTVGEVEISLAVRHTVFLSPKLVPFDPHPADRDTPAVPDDARRDEWERRDADLVRRRRELDHQAEELEADRALWYRRRQEWEQEQARETAPPHLVAREHELARVRDELSALREKLAAEYSERREQLAQTQELVRAGNARLQEERAAFAAEQERLRGALEAELEGHRARLEAEAAGRRALFEEEFRQKRDALAAEATARAARAESEALDRYRGKLEDLDRFQQSLRESAADLGERRDRFEDELAARRQKAEADAAEVVRRAEDEAARRRAALDAEVAAHQPRFAALGERQDRLDSALQDLAYQRETFALDRAALDADRAAFDRERASEIDRLVTLETALDDTEADLAQREDIIAAGRDTFDRDRRQLNDDLLRLDRRRAEAEDREQSLSARTHEAEVWFEQVRRDAAEWEETVRLATREQERLRDEADRLDRQRADLDNQTATLSERAAQLDAQQGVLALSRAQLERSRAEVAREASALAAARVREDESLADLRSRLHEAEKVRAELGTVQENTAQERRRLDERDSLLAAGLEEIRQQREALDAEQARLRERETALDARSAEFAEQAGALKGRMAQALDLQSRLEADRVAIREREAALAQAEAARAALQEQLRRRAEDLAARSQALDEAARRLAADRGTVDQTRTATDAERLAAAERVAALQAELDARVADLDTRAHAVAEREVAQMRQAERLKEVGQAVAEERKAVADARDKWEADRRAAEAAAQAARDDLDAFRARAAADVAALRAQAPELEEQAAAALARLTAAKDTLRGHLAELNDFARQSRDDLDGVRAQVRAEAERLRDREATLDRSRAEHRLAVTAFRQQLVDWQGQVGEMKRGLSRSESRLEAKQAAVDQAARQVDATSQHLAEQAEQLRRDREDVVLQRTEVELHLTDMREWYRRKLREIASGTAETRVRLADDDTPPLPRLADTGDAPLLRLSHDALEELDPGDRQLGELLRSLDLVDADTLAALWAEAGRQRRTLRQVLLASGAVTLYQLALIEAGNLDGLMLGRFRVIDRLRSTPKETLYRVLDPTRLDSESGGTFLLRHLSEAEAEDASHPDEFRQRFATARDAAHPNLVAVVDVPEIAGRPAAVLDWPTGLFSADWPAHAAHPGCWLKLLTMAANGIDAAHRVGLPHGRLTSDSFVLTAAGVLKVTGFGDPPWLAVGSTPSADPSPAGDLRALGQVAFGWSQLGVKKKGGRAGKPFPAELVGVIRRLEADPEPPMADTVAADRPYESAADLAMDLKRLARTTAFSDDAWDKLLRHVADTAPDAPAALRQSA